VLFAGVAASIAALPMLAAGAGERVLARTTAGAIAAAATGLMDVLAWLALAASLIGAGHRVGPQHSQQEVRHGRMVTGQSRVVDASLGSGPATRCGAAPTVSPGR
jgi:hypothetical protein